MVSGLISGAIQSCPNNRHGQAQRKRLRLPNAAKPLRAASGQIAFGSLEIIADGRIAIAHRGEGDPFAELLDRKRICHGSKGELYELTAGGLASLEVCARSSLVVDILVRLKSASFLWCFSGRPGASGEMDDKRGRERAPPEFISKNWSPQCDR